MTESTTLASASPSSNIILLTAPENIKFQGLPAVESIILVPFVPNVRSRLKIVHMAVPDTIPAAVVLLASPIPIVMFPPSLVPMAVHLITVVQSVHPANPILIAVRRRFPVTTDVPPPTPAVSAPLVRAIPIATCPINLVTADVLPQTPVVNVLPARPVRRQIPVQVSPAVLTLTAPAVLVTATPATRVMLIPDVLKHQVTHVRG